MIVAFRKIATDEYLEFEMETIPRVGDHVYVASPGDKNITWLSGRVEKVEWHIEDYEGFKIRTAHVIIAPAESGEVIVEVVAMMYGEIVDAKNVAK